MLNGTEAQFSVGWDSENNMVSLTTGEPYIPIGIEMQESKPGAVPFAVRRRNFEVDEILIDGSRARISMLLINGNNYVSFHDLVELLGLDVN